LTQLVFEHSLRIRLKAESSNEEVKENNLTVVGSQDGPSVDSNSGERASQSSQASTRISRDTSSDSQSTSNAPVKRKDKEGSSTPKSDTKSATRDKKKAQNLIGKINNLVTTDLGNIVDGRDFLVISTLQFFTLSLGLLSDNPASSIYPIPISSVHYLLIRSTWMEVSIPSCFERLISFFYLPQVRLLVWLQWSSCFRYPDILPKRSETYRFRG
jgi:hypothetical protein